MIHLLLLVSCYLSLFCQGLIDNSRGPSYPFILHDFHLSNAQGAWFFATSSAVQLVSTLGARYWLARWGTLGGLKIFLLTMSFGAALIGVSQQVMGVYGWGVALAGSLFFGLAVGGVSVSQNSLVTCAVTPHYQRRAYSGLHTMYGLSSLVAPLLLIHLREMGVSWGIYFILLSACPLILSFFVARLREVPSAAMAAAAPTSWHFSAPQWLLALALGLYVMAEVGISSRFVLYGVRDLQLSEKSAAELLSLFFVGLMGGRLLLGLFHVPFRSITILFLCVILSLGSFALGILWSPWMLSLTGLCMAPFFPTAMAWMAENLPNKIESTTTLIMLFQGLMLLLMHQLMGTIEQVYSVQTAMWVGPGALVLALASLIRLSKTV